MVGLKVCSVCGCEKALSEYYKHSKTRLGVQSYCKQCDRCRHTPADHRKRQLSRYGLTLEGYADLLVKQEGVCGICGARANGRPLCVDHCHVSGRVRGLLCQTCNKGMGLLQDNIRILVRAAGYVAAGGI